MKTRKIISMFAAIVATAATAGIVESTKSQPVLALTAELAPFGDVTRKITSFGTMINNPIVPTLLLTSGQQQLVQSYGRFRADAPICCLCYIQTPAWEVAATNSDQAAALDLVETVLVYPSVDGPARMALNHPGSTKEADGTIHLLPGEERPNDTYVKFTADGRFCTFAPSSALAARALADFAKLHGGRKDEKNVPLLRVELLERGVTALASLQKALYAQQASEAKQAATNAPGVAQKMLAFQDSRQQKMTELVEAIASCALTLDLDKTGLVADTRLLPKPGAKLPFATGFVLPAGVFDNVPATAPLFFFGGDRVLMQQRNEAEFRAELASVLEFLPPLFAEIAKSDDGKKLAPFLNGLEAALTQLIKEVPFPAETDWAGAWLGFDGAGHLYLDQLEQAAQAEREQGLADRFWSQIAAAVEKQWPGKGLVAKTPGAISLDIDALVDFYGAEAGVKPEDKEAKELANAKKKIASLLGSGKLSCTMTRTGNLRKTHLAAVGVNPAAVAQPTGEARVAAALPEASAGRPAAVFYLSPYALVRDAVLPIMAKTADKKDAQQYNAMIQAMPPAEANSALAGACWVESSGAFRSLLRVTAGEMKNLGAAFNAFTAASMASAVDND